MQDITKNYIRGSIAVVAFFLALYLVLLFMAFGAPMFNTWTGATWWKLAFYYLCYRSVKYLYGVLLNWFRGKNSRVEKLQMMENNRVIAASRDLNYEFNFNGRDLVLTGFDAYWSEGGRIFAARGEKEYVALLGDPPRWIRYKKETQWWPKKKAMFGRVAMGLVSGAILCYAVDMGFNGIKELPPIVFSILKILGGVLGVGLSFFVFLRFAFKKENAE